MKKNFVNKADVEGYVFSSELAVKTSQKGINYIGGVLNIATDDEGMNVVPVYFTYVAPEYNSGKKNPNYDILLKLIHGLDDGTYDTFESAGTNAVQIRINGNVDVNAWYNQDDELVETKRITGSFVHLGRVREMKATFETEMLISKVAEHENEETDETWVDVRGYIFNFRNEILPINYTVRSEAGMNYFLDADPSSADPLLTKVWGSVVNNTVKQERTIESAFGAPQVKSTVRSVRSYDIEGASAEPMEFDDEATITIEELKKALDDRTNKLAEEKKRAEEYRSSRNGGSSFSSAAKPGRGQKANRSIEDFVF